MADLSAWRTRCARRVAWAHLVACCDGELSRRVLEDAAAGAVTSDLATAAAAGHAAGDPTLVWYRELLCERYGHSRPEARSTPTPVDGAPHPAARAATGRPRR